MEAGRSLEVLTKAAATIGSKIVATTKEAVDTTTKGRIIIKIEEEVVVVIITVVEAEGFSRTTITTIDVIRKKNLKTVF